MESTEIALKRKIDEVVAIRNESVKTYQGILDSLASIERNLNSLDTYLFPHPRLDDLEKFSKELDKRLWNHCFDKLGVFTVMNHNNIEKLRREIEDKTPAFTEENIEATVTTMYQNRAKYFVEGIIQTFRELSHDHKTNTNDKFKIPDKCVIKYMLEPCWPKGLRLRYNREDKLGDIERTFCLLDKEVFEARKTQCEVNASLLEGQTYENKYFELKGYKNGNIHLRFKRIDLLDLANQMIADYYGNTLK
ncbi:MAG: DUF4942 domain-containing protein [Candidatus Brocadia sp.]|nr:DUF4942 domain-containing protein [Candidatus Brocadia sp.]